MATTFAATRLVFASMFILGHLGIGRTLASPWKRRLPLWPLLAGTLLPDVIDKPLYFLRLSDVFACTRTFGHTGLFVAVLFSCAALTRSRSTAAVAVGASTQLVLDLFIDLFNSGPSGELLALWWPLLGPFMPNDSSSFFNHLGSVWSAPVVVSEIAGLFLLGLSAWQHSASLARRKKPARNSF